MQNGIVGRSLVIFGPAPDNTRLACATIKAEAYTVATAAFTGMGGITGKIRSPVRTRMHVGACSRARTHARTHTHTHPTHARTPLHTSARLVFASVCRRVDAPVRHRKDTSSPRHCAALTAAHSLAIVGTASAGLGMATSGGSVSAAAVRCGAQDAPDGAQL